MKKSCWDIDVNIIGKFNIYMFDGNHKSRSHKRALTHYYQCLDDEFIYIVDDWSMPLVYYGTMKAIKLLNLEFYIKKKLFHMGLEKIMIV